MEEARLWSGVCSGSLCGTNVAGAAGGQSLGSAPPRPARPRGRRHQWPRPVFPALLSSRPRAFTCPRISHPERLHGSGVHPGEHFCIWWLLPSLQGSGLPRGRLETWMCWGRRGLPGVCSLCCCTPSAPVAAQTLFSRGSRTGGGSRGECRWGKPAACRAPSPGTPAGAGGRALQAPSPLSPRLQRAAGSRLSPRTSGLRLLFPDLCPPRLTPRGMPSSPLCRNCRNIWLSNTGSAVILPGRPRQGARRRASYGDCHGQESERAGLPQPCPHPGCWVVGRGPAEPRALFSAAGLSVACTEGGSSGF